MNENLTHQQRNQLEALAEEYASKKRNGDQVDIEQYVNQFPELASDIRDLFPIVAMLDQAAKPAADSLVLPSADPISNSQLGEYRLIRPIGRGGMGIVYLGEHVVLGSSVAIKVLPQSRIGIGQTKTRDRFLREASAAARMHHPNIVRVFDFGCQSDGDGQETYYYVMSLVDGWGLDRLIGTGIEPESGTNVEAASAPPTKLELAQTIAHSTSRSDSGIDDAKKVLENNQAFQETNSPILDHTKGSRSKSDSRDESLFTWVSQIGTKVADALEYAHSAGVIHRDIKPANLMIDADNRIYVTDFGLAKVVDEFSLTGTGDVLGTLRYMPPEAFSGRADQRSDIYGLGLTLYELLADRPAIDATNQANRGQLIAAISEGRITPLREIVTEVPRDLETIIRKSIEPEPADRYQTAADLRDDLKRFLAGQPIHARRATWAYRSVRWIGRNKTVATLMTLTILSLLGGLIASSIGWSRALKAEARAITAAENEKQAKLLALSETEAKQLALTEKQSALVKATEEKKHAEAISFFVRKDILAMTSVNGQLRFGDEDVSAIDKASTLNDVLVRASRKLDQRSDLAPLTQADLYWMIGVSFQGRGNDVLAIKSLQKAVDIREQHLGPNDMDTLRATNSLAAAMVFSSEIPKALELFDSLIERTKNHSENESFNLTCQTNRTFCLYRMGNEKKAIEELKEIRVERVKLSGEHYETAIIDGYLGRFYLQQKNYPEAIKYFEQAIAHGETTLKRDPLEYSNSLTYLGRVYEQQNQLEKAKDYFSQALDVDLDHYGEGHPTVALAKNNLANVCWAQGNFDQAIELYESASQLADSKIGHSHPHSIQILVNLRGVLDAAGQKQKALEVQCELLPRMVVAHDETNKKVLKEMNDLGFRYWELKAFDQSIPVFERLLRLTQETLDDDDRLIPKRMMNLAVNYRDAGDFAKSVPLFQSTIELSNDEKQKTWARQELQNTFVKMKSADALRELISQQLEIRKEALGEDSEEYLGYYFTSVSDMIAVDDYTAAITHLQQVVELATQYRPDSWQTFHCQSRLGELLLIEAGKFSESETEPDQKRATEYLEQAKSVLIIGYSGMKERSTEIPISVRKGHLLDAVDALIKHSRKTDDQRSLKKWLAEKEDLIK